MSQCIPQNEPARIPRDTYPIVRISSEFFLRGIDLLTRIQGDKLISGLLFMTVWHGQMRKPDADPVGVRELARKLNLPYETVRRHVAELVRAGQCVTAPSGISVPPAVPFSLALFPFGAGCSMKNKATRDRLGISVNSATCLKQFTRYM